MLKCAGLVQGIKPAYYIVANYNIWNRCYSQLSLTLGRMQDGITSLAVVLKHAAIFPDHEQAIGKLAAKLGFAQVR